MCPGGSPVHVGLLSMWVFSSDIVFVDWSLLHVLPCHCWQNHRRQMQFVMWAGWRQTDGVIITVAEDWWCLSLFVGGSGERVFLLIGSLIDESSFMLNAYKDYKCQWSCTDYRALLLGSPHWVCCQVGGWRGSASRPWSLFSWIVILRWPFTSDSWDCKRPSIGVLCRGFSSCANSPSQTGMVLSSHWLWGCVVWSQGLPIYSVSQSSSK